MRNLLNYIVTNFGFENVTEFSNSLIHKNLILTSMSIAAISSIFESAFGLRGLTVLAFVILVTLELVTGLVASKIKDEPIVSKKFGRFGLKILVWLILMFVINSLKLEYNENSGGFDMVANGLFTWLHGTLFIYVNLEYLISVLENLGVISGRSNDGIIKMIKDKFIKEKKDNEINH